MEDDYDDLSYMIDSISETPDQSPNPETLKILETEKQTSSMAVCKNCGSTNIECDPQTFQLICRDCGCCDKYNCKANIGLETDADVSFHGRSISKSLIPKNNYTIRGLTNLYLRNIQLWNSVSYNDRNIYMTFKLIKKKCKMLKLSKYVIDEVKILYYNVIIKHFNEKKEKYKKLILLHQTAKKKNISRGKNKLGLIGACVYYACKNTGYIKTIKEIAKVFDITTACMNNGCKKFLKFLKKSKISMNILVSTPSNFIKSLSDYFRFEGKKMEDYTDFIKKIEDNNLITTHTPYTIAVAATIYFWVKFDEHTALKVIFDENHKPLDNDIIDLKNKIKIFCILLELPKITNEELYEKIKNVNIPKLSEINKINLKTIIKAATKKLKTSGTIIMNIYEIIKGYDDFLFSNVQLEEEQIDILTNEELKQRYNRINNLREEDFASLNHIDTFDIVLNIHESVLNNNFIRKIKYL